MTTLAVPAHETERRLREIIAHVAKVAPDAFGPDDDLASTLGLDSLSALRIAAAVEREFQITIPDDRLHEVRTLRALAELTGMTTSLLAQ
jgi:acyl carrier protein